jgi:hypothetical protein
VVKSSHIFVPISKPRPGFPTPYVVIFLTVQLFEVVVRFVDIGGIVDHLSLNFFL